jgi:hypothetical protein
MIKINGIPIKTRVPPTVWAIAGLLTLVSIFEVFCQESKRLEHNDKASWP